MRPRAQTPDHYAGPQADPWVLAVIATPTKAVQLVSQRGLSETGSTVLCPGSRWSFAGDTVFVAAELA